MTAPPLSGFHHLKIPAADLDTSLDWHQRVLGADQLTGLDLVDSDEQFDDWIKHLNAHDVEHSPVLEGGGGIVIAEPDGKFIRLMRRPPGGLAAQAMPDKPLEPEGHWLDAPPMRHPRPNSDHLDQGVQRS